MRSDIGIPSRNTDHPNSVYHMKGNDTDWVFQKEHMVQREEGYLEMDDLLPGTPTRIPADTDTTGSLINARMVQEYKGKLYLAYITSNDSPSNYIRFHLTVSSDNGENWEPSVTVYEKTGSRKGKCEILIHDDKIFYFMAIHNPSSSVRENTIKITSYLNWYNMTDVPGIGIGAASNIEFSKMVPFGHKMVIFWKYDSSGVVFLRTYDQGTWSTIQNLGTSMNNFCPVVSRMSGTEILYLFYTSSAANIVETINSTDGGATWSDVGMIATVTNSIKYISGIDGGDGIHLGFSFTDVNVIGHGIYRSADPFTVDIIASFTANTLDPDSKEIMIGNNKDDIMIAFENSQGTIDLLISRNGKDFLERVQLGKGLAHSPSMDGDLSVICFMNDTDLEILPLVPATRGNIYTELLSPIGIASWNDFGFSASGFSPGSELEFRIWDAEMTTQLFPGSGYFDVLSLPERTIEGRDYRFAGDFSGNWSSGVDVVETIALELVVKRDIDQDPFVFDICVNYTVGYPYFEDLSEIKHIWDSADCTVTPVGLELNEGATTGWAIFGPVEFEASRPDHLSVYGTLLGNGNRIKAEILDRDMKPIDGFKISDSGTIETSGSEGFIKWGVRNLADVPETFSMIYVKIVFYRGYNSNPMMNWFKLGSSDAPTISGAMMSLAWINRGESARMTIMAQDREDPIKDLYLEVEYMDPVSGTWSSDLLSDTFWNGTTWIADIQTDMETTRGTYEFRARSEDRTGLLSEWTELFPKLEVRNNIPIPPAAALDPALPLVTDDIEITMIRPGKDLEIGEEGLRYTVYIIGPEGMEDQFQNLTTPDMVIQDLDLTKDENWTIEIRTWDGENESLPTALEFNVQNSKPFTTNRLPSMITIIEDEEWLEEGFITWFSDHDDGDTLSYTIEASPEIEVVQEGEDLRISPSEDFNGETFFEISASDGEIGIESNITVEVLEINDEPTWNKGISAFVEQDQWIYVDIGASDLKDPEDVNVELSISDVIPGILEGTNFFMYPNGSFELMADNGMVGEHNISFKVKDAEHENIGYLLLTVQNVNDAPAIDSAGPEGGSFVFLAGDDIVLTAQASDHDMIWGDQLTYEWSSHLSGIIGTGRSLPAQLPEGDHRITLMVTDEEGDSDSTSFIITVVGEEKEEGSVMRTWMLFSICGASSFLISLIIALIIFFIARSRRKEEPKEAEIIEEEKTEKKVGEDLRTVPELEGIKEALKGKEQPKLPPKQDGEEKVPTTDISTDATDIQKMEQTPTTQVSQEPPVEGSTPDKQPDVKEPAAPPQEDPAKGGV